MLEFGHIVKVKVPSNFLSVGDELFVVLPDGDGEWGLKGHAICWKLDKDKRPIERDAYEVSWNDLDTDHVQPYEVVAVEARLKELDEKEQELRSKREVMTRMRDSVVSGSDLTSLMELVE